MGQIFYCQDPALWLIVAGVGAVAKPAGQIEKDAPVFWAQLEEQLIIGLDGLPEDYSGALTTFEGGLRVTVNRLGMAFNQAYTDLFFKRGAAEIRCTTLHSGSYALKFCLTPEGKITVNSTRSADHMDPQQAADHVLQSMLH